MFKRNREFADIYTYIYEVANSVLFKAKSNRLSYVEKNSKS